MNSEVIDIQIDKKVFNTAYYPLLNDTTRTQILFGGSSSGKSVFLSQRCVYDLLKGGRNYLVCRQVGRTIRKSVFAEIKGVIDDWGLTSLFRINKTDGVITCESNGYQVLFVGLDDVEKIKSIRPEKGSLTDIWVEEATETDKATIKQLMKRQRGGTDKTPKRLMKSFNPIYITHWMYEDYFKKIGWTEDQKIYRDDDLVILKTTYKDNKFLTEGDIKDLENEDDPYFYNVYTLGNWGVLGNVIFRNWEVKDLSRLHDQFVNRRNGLDFGYADDPAASPRTHYDNKKGVIYIFDELYETGLQNDELSERLLDMHGKDLITADSAEPKSIAELNKKGLIVRGAKKGKDSVNHGIQWLQQQHIIVDKKCINSQNELSTYKWKEDAGGHALPIPVGKNDHLIDALRYAYENDMAQIKGKLRPSTSNYIAGNKTEKRPWTTQD